MSDVSNDSKFFSRAVRNDVPGKTIDRDISCDRKRLGEILVEQGIITSFTVQRILPLCAKTGRRFGKLLEDIGLITSEELASALSVQYGYKTVFDFAKYTFPNDLLKIFPVETAVEHTIFPLKIHHNTLALAVFDPTRESILQNIKENCGIKIAPFISTMDEINKAISRHYLNKVSSPDECESILVVEDDKLILKMVSQMLINNGYHVVTACDGMEAYKAIVCSKPKLVLTDKEMPRFNGYALLDSLKHIPETKNIPVILMSSSNNSEEEAVAYERGFFDYVQKPVKEASLVAKVKRALRSHSHLVSTLSRP